MKKEDLRTSFNSFLKLYFDSCKEVYEEIGMETKLSSRQFHYLHTIYKNEDITSSQLADKCKLSKPTVTEIVNKFVHLKLVDKVENKKDRRVSYLRLTDKGILLATTNQLESIRVIEKIQNKLSDEQQGLLKELFDQITGE